MFYNQLGEYEFLIRQIVKSLFVFFLAANIQQIIHTHPLRAWKPVFCCGWFKFKCTVRVTYERTTQHSGRRTEVLSSSDVSPCSAGGFLRGISNIHKHPSMPERVRLATDTCNHSRTHLQGKTHKHSTHIQQTYFHSSSVVSFSEACWGEIQRQPVCVFLCVGTPPLSVLLRNTFLVLYLRVTQKHRHFLHTSVCLRFPVGAFVWGRTLQNQITHAWGLFHSVVHSITL